MWTIGLFMDHLVTNQYPPIADAFEFLPDVDQLLTATSVDLIIRNIRAFFVLLPSKGISDLSWADKNKATRWTIIKEHLSNVCESKSINQPNIRRIDRWLTSRCLPRRDVSIYGYTLQKKFGSLCFICGKKIESSSTVDHIFPLAWGGSDREDNLMLAHGPCNSAKRDWIPGDSFAWSSLSAGTDIESIPLRMRYMVFLRDDFVCSMEGCGRGIFNNHELALERKHSTGICCFDNLVTICESHKQAKQ
jgi:5-methylcytosine-specific restriction endonuclease McrA